MKFRNGFLASGCALLALSSQMARAEEGEADAGEEIVVVGALTDVEIDREEIEIIQANDLADLFRQVPSVSVGGGVGLAQKIYVRGLEDSLLNVTIDGAPQRGTLFHHIGRVTIEPELLETVDVQAGPGEATAGFGAVGGAIRFRTRDAVDMLQDGRNIGGIAKAGWFSNDGYKLSGTLYGRIAGDVGILASYVHVNRDPYQDGDGVTQLATGAKQNLGFVKIGGELGGGHRITASYEHRRESGRFGQRPNWPVLAGARLFPVKGKRQTAVLNYGYEASDAVGIEATGYWTRTNFSQDRFDRWGLYGAEIETWGFDARANLSIANHDITVGAEHRRDRVNSAYLADPAMWQPWAWDPAIGSFTEKGSLMGVYVQDHWRVIDPLLISFGARFDAYDLDQTTYRTGTNSEGLSFNAGAQFEVFPGLTLNAGYAEAFRGKEIGDAFTLEKRPGRLSLSPTLRPEKVDNVEGGVKYDAGGFTASAVYYEMRIRDVILDQLGRNAAQPVQDAVFYENVGKFKTRGVELRAGYRTGPFSVDAYYNHYDSRLNGNRIEGYEHIALGNSLGDNWAVTVGFEPTDTINLRASLTRFEDLNDIEVLFRESQLGFIDGTRLIDKPGYTTVDLFASWRPLGTDMVELQAAVYNLFDQRYIAHASTADYGQLGLPDYAIVSGLPEPGRNIRLTAAFRF
ncbi:MULTISPECIES: TonB-dependent receptor domain-containing protein [unclassified Sphingopyxis]|uniref:TonB-dependent receptor domain-containing protein n=1 Tax=unclassified Sphingopyxis TaxID=2614943 RepID=UPI0007367CC2|nr:MULTISPECIES: TonB-dependent receptor [unclassified Sphingopyxis]KTE44211.1 TonB-dependent receptor [Sphingopyxis sp. HIX]KTE85861.1 TonB-dependent receptor [Sphingopyxis sp. HXXIV]